MFNFAQLNHYTDVFYLNWYVNLFINDRYQLSYTLSVHLYNQVRIVLHSNVNYTFSFS